MIGVNGVIGVVRVVGVNGVIVGLSRVGVISGRVQVIPSGRI